MKHLQKANLRYPGLWRGCVGAWAPLLGPSGLVLRDNSGFGKHGTLTGMDAATDWVVSGSAYALNFDGVDNSIDYGDLNAIDGVGQLTMSVWIFSKATQVNYAGIVAKTDTAGTSGSLLSFGGTGVGTTQSYRFAARGGSNTGAYTTDAVSVTGAWQHVAAVYDGSQTVNSDRITIYVGGVSYALTIVGTIPATITANAEVLWTGRDQTTGRFCNAYIDDVRCYTRALSKSEVALLATRRGIAYETIQRRSYKSAAAPAGNRRRRIICGQG